MTSSGWHCVQDSWNIPRKTIYASPSLKKTTAVGCNFNVFINVQEACAHELVTKIREINFDQISNEVERELIECIKIDISIDKMVISPSSMETVKRFFSKIHKKIKFIDNIVIIGDTINLKDVLELMKAIRLSLIDDQIAVHLLMFNARWLKNYDDLQKVIDEVGVTTLVADRKSVV